MSLRYPERFRVNAPYVIFQGYDYEAPHANLSFTNARASVKRNNKLQDIVLYVPGDFTENIGATWGLEDVLQGSGGNIQSQIVSNVAGAAANAPGGSKVVNSAQAAAGRGPLPSDILIFKQVDPMTISFNFKMIPYNKTESDTILEICNSFKKNIMPRLDGDIANALLKFPVLWDITFDGINGMGMFDMTDARSGYELMALTSCNVNYSSGTESAAVYYDKNPVQINLSLSFQYIRKHWLD